MSHDQRRRIPRTDAILADPAFGEALAWHPRGTVKRAIHAAQERARSGELAPSRVAEAALARLAESSDPGAPTTLRRVLNATGVVVHTNLARAPLSQAALDALAIAGGGYSDFEFDLARGTRGPRGRGALDAVLDAIPAAEAALVVNNGAAALLVATAALASGRELIVSRGEVVEIGDGFRLMDLVAAAGVEVVEVGTTNRTTLADYVDAVTDRTGAILKVHPSNFVISGFAASVPVAELARVGVPLIADIGSGLLSADAALPAEPDADSTLAAGAALVTCSGDKLLGGPQAGLLLGRPDLVERCRRHPLARAVRADKLTFAALEATLRGPSPPVHTYLHADADTLRGRCEAIVEAVRASVPGGDPQVEAVDGSVGGGGAPGVPLPGWAVALPERYAALLRSGHPPVVTRLHGGRCLVDPRCIEPADDPTLVTAILAVPAG